MNALSDLAMDAAHLLALRTSVRQRLAVHGPILVELGRTRLSFREMGERVGCSANYLSLVSKGATVMSAEVFVRLSRVVLLEVEHG